MGRGGDRVHHRQPPAELRQPAVPGEARVTAQPATPRGRPFASPLSRRLAAIAGIDLARVIGSGPGGRIVKADIEAAITGGAPRAAATPATVPAPHVEMPGGPAYDELPNNNIRKVVARRLTESKQQAPHFYLSLDCEIDALLKLRADLNTRAEKDGVKLSVNDLVIKAAAIALRKVPAANASYTEAAIRRYKTVDISVAVAIPDGLITPIVRNADIKGLAAISAEMKDLAA
ncbi:MAG: 2-oxo acid dehydrogenase subunit E2, partial [Rhodospirillaceae bacterium]|nr:2-oxo acid dehydrogenase subunit E2 [Rhodospirillaceae bacterium]